jgi:hypothetical protein
MEAGGRFAVGRELATDHEPKRLAADTKFIRPIEVLCSDHSGEVSLSVGAREVRAFGWRPVHLHSGVSEFEGTPPGQHWLRR